MENKDEIKMNSGKSHREKPMGKNMTKLRKLRGSDIWEWGEN